MSQPLLAYGTTWPEGKVFGLRERLFLKPAGLIVLIQVKSSFLVLSSAVFGSICLN